MSKDLKIFSCFVLPVLITLACNTTEPPVDNIPPGRRDYIWSVDTLDGLNSPRYRMWGSSPTDVWATTTSNWDVSISHFDGSSWTSYGVPGIIQPNAVYGFSNNYVYIGDENGKIWKFDGGS